MSRKSRRFRPTWTNPARVTIEGESGWSVRSRRVLDISEDGLAVKLSEKAARDIVVGEPVTLILELGPEVLTFHGRSQHLSQRRAGWRSPLWVSTLRRTPR